MNYVPQLFESSWAQALGWTLLHSLWQSFLVLGIVIILFRFISGRQSSVRYGIAAIGLLIIFLASTATFLYNVAATSPLVYHHSLELSSHTGQPTTGSDVAPALWDQVHAVLQSNIPLITGCWLAGALFFCLRLAGSWWYVSSLKRRATILDNEWSLKITTLARQFKIDRIVTLAETVHLSAPAVVGYLKPVILIPAGMLSGLSAEQVESILIHELTHIRRHDYLVNIIQSLVEALFFFNPFVWIVSNMIRREREHCCDDAVVAHSNASAYAYALVQLEESRLTRTGLAVSLAANKNQLLNRITRIMEKSVRNYSGREKIIPVLLLVAGLLCASWISIQSQPGKGKAQEQNNISSADTTIKKKPAKPASPPQKMMAPPEAHAHPQVEIMEEFDIVEAPEPFVVIPPFEVPALPEMDELMIPPVEVDIDMDLRMDTIPSVKWSRDWEKFSQEFESKFKEQFGCSDKSQRQVITDFSKEHQEDFQKMMQEFTNDFQFRYDDKWSKEMNHKVKVHTEKIKVHTEKMKVHTEKMKIHTDQLKVQAKEIQAKAMTHQKAMKADMEKKFQYIEKQQKEVEKQRGEIGKKLKSMEENMERFEKALQEQLVKDGYLKSDEKISSMHWSDEGIEINNIKINESDRPRYQELHDRYFK